jgi:two-component system sensor histidine kinase BaeS
MVDDVLLVERLDTGHMPLYPQPVKLNTIAEDVVATFRPIAGAHHFVLDLQRRLRAIDGDPDRLAQALTNLVSNAVKYSPAGGTITIATRNEGDDVVLSVRDQGLGIAPDDLSRIFDRFERVETGTAGRIPGTGLGLYIVREIVNLHHGRLHVGKTAGRQEKPAADS